MLFLSMVRAPTMPCVVHYAVHSAGGSGYIHHPAEHWDGTSLRSHIHHLGAGLHETLHCTKLVQGLLLSVFAKRVLFIFC